MPVIAIDGPSASGKGTLAKALARHFGFHHLDTGRLYRALGKKAREYGFNPQDHAAVADLARRITQADLADPHLAREDIGQLAARFAPIPAVRAAIIDFSRRFARKSPGTVLDGRDVGRVICPEAEVKLFICATLEARAQRRLDEEHNGKGAPPAHKPAPQIKEEMMTAIALRDARDAKELEKAADVLLLDTSDLTINEMVEGAIALIGEACPRLLVRSDP